MSNLQGRLDQEYRQILKEISALKSTLESSLPMSVVNPAFQWAQSPTEILLNIKFSHNIGAPATLNVEAQHVTLLEDRLLLRASDGRKQFNLDLNFSQNIVPEESRYDVSVIFLSFMHACLNMHSFVSQSTIVGFAVHISSTSSIIKLAQMKIDFTSDVDCTRAMTEKSSNVPAPAAEDMVEAMRRGYWECA